MRYLSIAAVFCLAIATLPAVASANSNEKIIGKWEAKLEVDEDKLKKLLADQGTPPELVDMILPMVVAQLGNASIIMEFKEDNSMEFTAKGIPGQEESKEGKWEIVKEDGDKLTIKSTQEGEEEVQEITFDGDDKFTLTAEGLEEAPIKPPVFKRVKDE